MSASAPPTSTSSRSFTTCVSLLTQRGFEVVQEYRGLRSLREAERDVRGSTRSSRMHVGKSSRWYSSPPSTESRGASSISCKSWTSSTVLAVVFISRRENVDTSGPMGRLFLTLIGSIAELESDLIRERVLAGMRRAKLDGVRIGRAPMNIDRAAIVRDRIERHDLNQRGEEVGHLPQFAFANWLIDHGLVTRGSVRPLPSVVDAVGVVQPSSAEARW